MQVRKRSPDTRCIPLPPQTVHVHDPKDQTMDSVWVENPRPIPKWSLRDHCIDLLLRQVLEQLCCTEPCSGGHQLKTRGQATDHRGRIQPRGTQRLQP